MTTTEQISKPRWFERVWVGFVSSFLVCAAAAGISMFLQFTLADSLSQRIDAGIFLGFIFGGMAFVFFAGPVQGVLLLLVRWLKLSPRWRALCSQLPAWVFFFYVINSSLVALSPSGERKWFELAVGVPFPANAKLVLTQHGLGVQDRRHLWLLEGEPADFDRLVKSRGWALNDNMPHNMTLPGMQRTKEHFGKSAAWQPDVIYYWAADKDATKGPLGMSCLFADQARKRWAVWVMD